MDEYRTQAVAAERQSTNAHSLEGSSRTLTKQKDTWIQHYADRILSLWSQWQTELGVTSDYVDTLKGGLAEFFEDPLKKMFIEASY